MIERLRSYDIIAMDESRFQVLNEQGKSVRSQSYIGVQRGGPPDSPVILFHYDPSQSQDVPLRLLDGFTGYFANRCVRRLRVLSVARIVLFPLAFQPRSVPLLEELRCCLE